LVLKEETVYRGVHKKRGSKTLEFTTRTGLLHNA